MRKPDPTATNLKVGALEKWLHRLCLLDGISDFFFFLWRLEGTCSRLPPSRENRRYCLCGTGLHQTLNLLASLDLRNCQPNLCSWVCSSRLSGARQMPRHQVAFLVITLEQRRRQCFHLRMLLKDESYWLFSRSWTFIEQLSGDKHVRT